MDPAPTEAPAELPVADLDDASVFGGTVTDTHNALQPRGDAQLADADDVGAEVGDMPTPAKRRKKKGEKEPVVITDEHMSDALGLVVMVTGYYEHRCNVKWGDELFDPEWKRAQLAKIHVSDEEAMTMARPLARGFAELGISAPWWAQLALASFAVMGPRMSLVAGIDAAIAKREREKTNAPA